MSTATVARKKRNDVTVKLDAEVVRKARVICAHRDGQHMAEYLSDLLKPLVEEEYEQYRPATPAKPRKPSRREDAGQSVGE